MVTHLPERQEIDKHELDDLRNKIRELEEENKKLNIAWMRKSAEASEAREQLIRWGAELKVLVDQTGHNLCWISIAKMLKNTIGHTGKYPDPDNVSPEQFAHGCVNYHGYLFPNCGVKLMVIK